MFEKYLSILKSISGANTDLIEFLKLDKKA